MLADQAQSSMCGVVLDERVELLEELGRGGMGIVYKGWHRLLERHVAVKVLYQHLATDEKNVVQMRSEARIVADLEHPNIVKVLAFGITNTGAPYLIMELLQGPPLNLLIAENGGLSLKRSVRLMLQVTRALGYAHGRGVVHKDIKTGNIVVERNAMGEEVAKLVDFGIAKHGTLLSSTQTRVVGTVAYLSPEQCLGQRGGMLSDLYSLGCVIHATMLGDPPFRGESTVETLQMHVSQPPPRVGELRSDVPRSLEKIVLKLLAKDPAHRYQSAALLADDLEMVQEHLEKGSAEPEIGTVELPERDSGRGTGRRRVWVVASAIALAAVAAAGYLHKDWQPHKEPVLEEQQPRTFTIIPKTLSSKGTKKEWASTYDLRGNKLLLAQELSEGLNPKYKLIPETQAIMHLEISRCYVDAGSIEKAHTHAEEALRYFRTTTQDAQTALCYAELARCYALAGDQEESKKALIQSELFLGKKTDRNMISQVRSTLAVVQSLLDDRRQLAPQSARDVIAEAGGHDSHHSQHIALLLSSLSALGKWEEVVREYERDLNGDNRALEGCSKVVVLKQVGQAYKALKNDQQAIRMFEDAIETAGAGKLENMSASSTAQECRLSLAQIWHRRGDYNQEIKILREGLSLWKGNTWAAPSNRLQMLEQLRLAFQATNSPQSFADYESDYQSEMANSRKQRTFRLPPLEQLDQSQR